MTEEKMGKGLYTGFHGLTDPGTALIVVYVSIVLFLLLFAGLESARADEKTLNDVHHEELMIPALEAGGFIIDTPSFVQNITYSIQPIAKVGLILHRLKI